MQTEQATPILLTAGEGDPYWTMGMLLTVKAAAAQTGGEVGAMEVVMPAGSAPPFHIHHHEAEINYVLDGVITFQCGEVVRECGPGSFIYLPRGVPHRFKAGPDGARMLGISAPGGLEGLYTAVGEPAGELRLPDAPPNVAGWLAHAGQYGIEVIGPPLG
jgi:quercetin dioxygenase-like cupin family protein